MAVIARQYPNLDGLGLPLALTRAIHDAYQRLYDLRDKIFSSTTSVTQGSNYPTIVDVNPITASTAQPFTVPANAGNDLIFIIQQDAAGGHAVSFDMNFVATASSIDTTAGTVSTFRFVFSSSRGKYVMTGQPTTGMNP